LAELYLEAKAFQSGRLDAVRPDAHAMAGRFVPAQAALDGPAPDALEILMAGPRALQSPWALALPADLLARREAMDSNSAWEAPL